MRLKIVLFLIIQCLIFSSLADDYPKSRREREIDDMGSMIGGEGIVFRPKFTKNTATKATTSDTSNVNKYLYEAALEILKFAPIASADSNNGIIITDWYSPSDSPNTQFKINVFVKDDIISSEALEVNAFERNKKGKEWSNDIKKSQLSSTLEDKILRKARDLYILNNSKK